jgi:putative nucleotidyltransferase with HDIG domain
MSPVERAELDRRIGALPPRPVVVSDIAQMLDCEPDPSARVAERISQDRSVGGRLLRVANTPPFRALRDAVSIEDAVAMLGVRTAQTAVTAIAIRGRLPHTAIEGFDYIAFWRHSIGVALCTRALASRCTVDPDDAFIAGLVHDIGRAVLATTFPERYVETLALQRRADCPLEDAERSVLGFDHGEAGHAFAKHWGFAPPILDAVLAHHAPLGRGPKSLAALVHVGDVIASALDLSQVEDARVPRLDGDAWDGQRFDETSFHEICSATLAPFPALCDALGG